MDCKKPNPATLSQNCIKVNFGIVEDMIWTQIRFYFLQQQNVTQFSENPLIHQKHENDVLCGNVNMEVSPTSGNYAISRIPNFSTIITHL